jgi:uncharacterized protein
MLLDITELLSVKGLKESFTVKYEQEFFKTGREAYPVAESPEFELSIANVGERKLLIQGNGSVVLVMPCGRCLEEVHVPVEFELDRSVDLNGDKGVQTDEDVEEVSYIDGYHLDVDDLVYTEILINLPLQVLCSEDCKGLCFKCGANLNKGECGCDREQLDPRMSVIQDIFKNFKEV